MANSFEPFRSRDSRSFSEIPRRRSASERLVFSPMLLLLGIGEPYRLYYGYGGEMEADLFFIEKTMRERALIGGLLWVKMENKLHWNKRKSTK